jgi:leucyl aminopeptidase
MNVSIEYNSDLSSQSKNIVIFVSSISQLKSLQIPINLSLLLNNKEFNKNLKYFKFINFFNFLYEINNLLNIKIVLINFASNSHNLLGASIFDDFKNKHTNNVNFIFSKDLYSDQKSIISEIIFGFCLKSYSFTKYKKENSLIKSNINLRLYKLKQFKELIYKINLFRSINFTKNLISEPANILNPVSYAEKCTKLRDLGLKVKVLNKTQLENIGMRSLLAVSKGSSNEPRVIIFEWNLKKNKKPTILVGKGVTFDTGGISLKPSEGMEDMIFDMAGSAVVVGSMMNAALNNFSHSIVGIIGLVENMPDGNAQRPGDIVKSLSGATIEVLNTDAEGRMILADILSYIQNKFQPKQIIDFATLTGAIMVALGTHRAGLFSNNDILSKKLENAGDISGEKLWRLPMGDEYDNEINSRKADMQNIGTSKYGGSIHAAQFIQRFIKDKNAWAHLDIAGVSWTTKDEKNSFSKLNSPGATAFGVRLIDQFLKGK